MLKHSRYFDNPYGLNHEGQGQLQLHLKMVKERLIPQTVEAITRSVLPDNADSDYGLYSGKAGIAYAFYHSSKAEEHNRQSYLRLAQQYLQPAIYQLKQRRAKNRISSSLLCGDAGIIAVAIVIATAIGDDRRRVALTEDYLQLSNICMPMRYERTGSDEFFVGRAGYIYGALWLNKNSTKPVVPLSVIHALGRTVIAEGKNYAAENVSPCPLMYTYYGTEYLGAAHGLSSILQTLIQIPDFLDTNREADSLVHTCVDYLLRLESSTGNYPCVLDEVRHNARSEEEELIHWCHGAPGMVYLFGAAYLRWHDQRYIDAIQRAGELVWRKGLLRKGPGICHGVAGNGYVFLLLYRLTTNPMHLERAVAFADFLNDDNFKRNARTPDKPYSLYEGLAGTLCYLADLGSPEKAFFPFQDIFL